MSNGKRYSLNDVLTFGKHKGEQIRRVINVDNQYISWCVFNIPGFRLDEEADTIHSKAILEKMKTRSTRNRKYYYSDNCHDRQDDADFASCFDWGSQ